MKILIFGGSSDIGISLAKYLSNRQNEVIVTYHKNKCDIDNCKTIHCDITNEKEIEEVIKKYNKVDCIINLFAISRDDTLLESTKRDFMDTLEVNLVGSYLTSKIYIKNNPNGMIINMASTDGIDTYNEYNTFYAVSKAGIIHLTKCLALATKNSVYCVCPNWIDSDSTRNIDKEYLDKELERIGQKRLITIDEICSSIYKIIMDKEESGTIYRIDIKGEELWIKKI